MNAVDRGHRTLITGRKLLGGDARRNNRSLLLQSLFRSEGMSRADLARLTGLTRATVSDLTLELENEGLVATIARPRPGTVGKPPTMLGIVPDARRFLGVDLSADRHFTAAAVNLVGEPGPLHRVARGKRTGPKAVQLCLDLVEQAVADSGPGAVSGIGIGAPGLVDDDGVVLHSTNLAWRDVPLRALVEERTGLRTEVVNDANAATLAAFTVGRFEGSQLFVLKLGQGVGAGLILGGRLFTGGRPGAGEVGHIVVDPKGRPCACGRTGCLETVVSVPALALDAAAGNTRAPLHAARRLGEVLAVLVAALRLDEIVISGPEDPYDAAFLEVLTETTAARVMPSASQQLVVRRSSLGDIDVLLGASVLVMSEELGLA